jgi:hypothetical protein
MLFAEIKKQKIVRNISTRKGLNMNEMLIKMVDGGLVNYTDDCHHYDGCPTCDYGSQYINEIDVTLTKYKIHVRTNQMYEYVLSEGQMIKLFLSEYNTIQTMVENEFIDWFKKKLVEIANDEFKEDFYDRRIEAFDVTEIK